MSEGVCIHRESIRVLRHVRRHRGTFDSKALSYIHEASCLIGNLGSCSRNRTSSQSIPEMDFKLGRWNIVLIERFGWFLQPHIGSSRHSTKLKRSCLLSR